MNSSTTNQQGQDFVSAPNILYTAKNLSVKDKLFVDDKEIRQLHGQKFKRTSFSTLVSGSTFSLTATDYLLGITSLSYAPKIGLPNPLLVGVGKTFIVKDEAGGSATTTITVTSAGEKTIDGSSSSTLTTNYQAKRFYTDGANWFTY